MDIKEGQTWDNVDSGGEVPDYIRAYADGFIDALDTIGFLHLNDRLASPERDEAREASTHALLNLVYWESEVASDADEFDLGGEG